MITAVTTSMGRKSHLELSLPLMLAEFPHVVVVDWSCPDSSGEWAFDNGASVVYKCGEKLWHASKARNYGARCVTTEYVCFIDADSMVMPGLFSSLVEIVKSGAMALASRCPDGRDEPNLHGFLACSLGDFWSVGGYDESFSGYALEDMKLRAQLLLEAELGVKQIPPMTVGALQHSNELRGKYMPEPIETSAARNRGKLQDYFLSKGISDWLTDNRTEPIALRQRR